MKKKIIISIIIVTIIILSIIIILNTYNSKIIFKMTGESFSNGAHYWGYTINSNGIIKESNGDYQLDESRQIKISPN